jgi:hypothetical protein
MNLELCWFYSRIGQTSDYTTYDRHIAQTDIYTIDPYLPRTSCDFDLNRFGDRLLDLCKSTNFRIDNGRMYSNKGIGKFTCMTYNGENVVDYLVTSQSNFEDLADFYVHDFNEFPNHAPMSFSFKVNSIQ